jgi:NAD(P)H-dependent FMN reductase
MKIIGVIGSAVASGRTRKAVEHACVVAAAKDETVSYELIDVSEKRVSILDGRRLDEYGDDTAEVIRTLESGDVFIMGSPVYRGTYTGAFKNLLDHTPLKALEGKVVGLVATGATPHHYLVIDHEMRSVLAWYNTWLVPGSVYVDDSSYQDGNLGEDVKGYLQQLAESALHLHRQVTRMTPGPAPLVSQLRKQ